MTLGVFRGKHIERTYRIKQENGVAISCKRSDIYTLKDANCPSEVKKLLSKKRKEKQLLDQMSVPIKRERLSIHSPERVISFSSVLVKQEVTEDETM